MARDRTVSQQLGLISGVNFEYLSIYILPQVYSRQIAELRVAVL